MRIGVGLSIPELATRGGRFSPASLFTGGVQGAWYAPDDFSTLFQDSAGTTPVTAVEQPVGLMLDKSQGLVLGSELVTNGDFSSGTTGWTAGNSATLSVTGGKLSVVNGAVSLGQGRQTITTVAGKTYKLSVTFTSVSASRGYVFVGTFAGDNSRFSAGPLTTSQTVTGYFTAAGTSTYLSIGNADNSIGLEVQFDDVTVKDIAGNHASQATAASRPVLRARYNLLTYSEQFNNGAWSLNAAAVTANQEVAPDGTTTADKVANSTTTLDYPLIYQGFTLSAAATVTQTVYAKAGSANFLSMGTYDGTVVKFSGFNLSNGTVNVTAVGHTVAIVDAGGGWYRCSVTYAYPATTARTYAGVYKTSGTPQYIPSSIGADFIYIWGADARIGSSAGTYQRIAAATDYATAGFLPYLFADGVDDSMVIPVAAISGATAMTEMHGTWKPAGVATGPGAVFGGTGTALINDHEPFTDGNLYYGFASTTRETFGSMGTVTVPYLIDSTQTGTTLAVYKSGSQLSTTKTTSIGIGTTPRLFLSNNATNYFYAGNLFGGVLIQKVLSASEMASLRSWMAAKSGVTL